jgi:hypothetical protein
LNAGIDATVSDRALIILDPMFASFAQYGINPHRNDVQWEVYRKRCEASAKAAAARKAKAEAEEGEGEE